MSTAQHRQTSLQVHRFSADDNGEDPNVDNYRPFPMQHKVMGWLENYRHTMFEDFFIWQPACPCSYV
jgi:hypothetical protein